jgi:hypothetical protein
LSSLIEIAADRVDNCGRLLRLAPAGAITALTTGRGVRCGLVRRRRVRRGGSAAASFFFVRIVDRGVTGSAQKQRAKRDREGESGLNRHSRLRVHLRPTPFKAFGFSAMPPRALRCTREVLVHDSLDNTFGSGVAPCRSCAFLRFSIVGPSTRAELGNCPGRPFATSSRAVASEPENV